MRFSLLLLSWKLNYRYADNFFNRTYSSMIRRKNECQNGGNKKTKQPNISEK